MHLSLLKLYYLFISIYSKVKKAKLLILNSILELIFDKTS